jgi:hypothetical protein
MAEWGQGERGAAGYPDHGKSELRRVLPTVEAAQPQRSAAEEPESKPKPQPQGEHKTEAAGALPPGLIRCARGPQP